MEEITKIEHVENKSQKDLGSVLIQKIKNSFVHIMESTNLIMRNDSMEITDIRGLISDVHKIAKESQDILESIPNIFNLESDTSIHNDDSNVNNIINEIVRFYKSETIKKSLSVRLSLCDEVILKVDENKLNIIFRNIILNAFKYTDHNDFVEISTNIIESSFYFVVTDNGMGMKREQIQQIFENEEFESKGLRKCQELIKGLDGDLIIGSEMGMGTKVTVSIPIE